MASGCFSAGSVGWWAVSSSPTSQWHIPKVMHCAGALPCYSCLAVSVSPLKATIFRDFNLFVKTCSRHYKIREFVCLFIVIPFYFSFFLNCEGIEETGSKDASWFLLMWIEKHWVGGRSQRFLPLCVEMFVQIKGEVANGGLNMPSLKVSVRSPCCKILLERCSGWVFPYARCGWHVPTVPRCPCCPQPRLQPPGALGVAGAAGSELDLSTWVRHSGSLLWNQSHWIAADALLLHNNL